MYVDKTVRNDCQVVYLAVHGSGIDLSTSVLVLEARGITFPRGWSVLMLVVIGY